MENTIINIDFNEKQINVNDKIYIIGSSVIEKIKKCGLYIKNIDCDFLTIQMCKYAVNQNGLALEYVPEIYQTYEICLNAIKQNKLAKQFVKNKKIIELIKVMNKSLTKGQICDIETNLVDLQLVTDQT